MHTQNLSHGRVRTGALEVSAQVAGTGTGSRFEATRGESTARGSSGAEPIKERTPRLNWVELLRRTFALDVFACFRCSGRRGVLAHLTAPGEVRAILEHLALRTRPVKLDPAQGPSLLAWC
jgi:hypothetical protein